MTMQDLVKQWAATKKHKTWLEEYANDSGHKLPNSVEVRAALESFSLEDLNAVADKRPEFFVRDGVAILRWQAKQNAPAVPVKVPPAPQGVLRSTEKAEKN